MPFNLDLVLYIALIYRLRGFIVSYKLAFAERAPGYSSNICKSSFLIIS